MITVVLAAGYGTRLYPLTLNKPKALLEVGGKSILDRLVCDIDDIDACKKVIIVTNESPLAVLLFLWDTNRYYNG